MFISLQPTTINLFTQPLMVVIWSVPIAVQRFTAVAVNRRGRCLWQAHRVRIRINSLSVYSCYVETLLKRLYLYLQLSLL